MIVVEGVRSIALPCTLVLLVPTVAFLLVGRLRLAVAVAIVLAAGAVAWWQAVAGLAPPRGWAGGLGLAAVAATGGWLVGSGARGRAIAGAALAGALAGLLWEPCVGPELGRVLTSAPRQPGATLLPMLGFVVGALSPLLALGALARVWPRPALLQRLAVGGRVGVGLFVVLLATGTWRAVASALVRLSV